MKRNTLWILVTVMALLVVASVALADPKPPGIDPAPSPTVSDTK